MVQTSSTITLSSLYSSGQCLLSVLGSIGVILLFAGIPQLIYAPQVNPGSLMTFLLGALLISLMVAGNAFIGYKYRQLVRDRREETRQRTNTRSVLPDDKPPSYDDLLKEEGLPPAYATIITEKPPRYEELVTEVINWQALSKVPQPFRPSLNSVASSSSSSTPLAADSAGRSEEVPIIIPIHKHLHEIPKQSSSTSNSACLENLAFQSSIEDLVHDASQTSDNSPSQKNTTQQQSSQSEEEDSALFQRSSSSAQALILPSLHIVGQKSKTTTTESSAADNSNSLQVPQQNESFS